MSRKLLSKYSFLSIEYDQQHYIYANWLGYVDVRQVKMGCEQILEEMQRRGCTDLLNDNRRLRGTWTQAVPWLAHDFIPRVIRSGLKKVAFIYSRDQSARYSVDRLLELNDQYVAQTFEYFELAEKWLLNEPLSPAEVILPEHHYPMLTLRSGERHFLIDPMDIYYLYSQNGEVHIQTGKEICTCRHSLKSLVEQLPSSTFQRIHRSYVVNVREISNIKYHAGGSYHVFLKSMPGIRIPVSRGYAPLLKQRLGISFSA